MQAMTGLGRVAKGLARRLSAAAAPLRRLWEPLDPVEAGKAPMVVSSDGEIGYVSLGILPGRTAGEYFLDAWGLAMIPPPEFLPEVMETWSDAGDIGAAGDDRASSRAWHPGGVLVEGR